MSTTKHTPGPWHARTYPNARGQITAIKLWARDEFQGDLVCAMSPETPNSVEAPEAYANARLIAAAPELLEACKAAVAALSQPVQFSNPDQRVFDNRPVEILRGDAKFAREALQAAIDKATKGEKL